ncbi:GDNF-inducible zinc finger protein 1-like [Ptychodera flava]|uniref:GDNF-inducible zinc finger protein 1-like n=1 Tax=Ptychodera flava TaxID=63121 RepID=UPI00396A6D15
MAKPQDSTKSKMSRTYWIDQLFDRGEELMEKLGCQVFILVSEDGICSKYMGSEVFLNEFRSCGLKIMEQDVHRISRNIGIQSGSMIIADAQEGTASQGTEARLMEIATRRDYMRRMKVKTTEDCKNVREKMQQILTESYASKENMCQSCGLSFKNPKRLKLHQKKATCSGRKCHFCGKMFPFKDWKDHLLDDHMEKMKIHECQLCKKQFVLSCNYRSHMRIHKRNGDIIRKQTQEQKLESEDDLGNHRVRIQKFFKEFCDSKPNLCERCGYSFRNPHGLEVHKQRASCSGRRCRFCGMSFLYKEWQQHLLESHLAEVKIYKCKLCEKQFMRYPDLYKHVQIHKGKKTSCTCDICGRTLKTETSLATHKLMHEGKEFKCDYCDL